MNETLGETAFAGGKHRTVRARGKWAVKTNRAPVLTLWASILAECLGQDEGGALTLRKVVAALNAQAKRRRLGIYEGKPQGAGPAGMERAEGLKTVVLLRRSIPVVNTKEGMRALNKGNRS